jgi:osmotically-inducible protein OsmY
MRAVRHRTDVNLRKGRLASMTGLLFAALLVPGSFAAKPDKNHQDCFVPGPADEGRIAKEVRHQLLLQPYYGVFDDLAFKVEGNTVTLVGATANPVLKSNAASAVKRIEGVEMVNNEIELLPVSSFDDQIRIAEYRAIYGDPSISVRYAVRAIPPIHIIVKSGHVTLEGVVANQMDKQIVYLRANTVPGVFSVTNDLQVEHS